MFSATLAAPEFGLAGRGISWRRKQPVRRLAIHAIGVRIKLIRPVITSQGTLQVPGGSIFPVEGPSGQGGDRA